MAPESIIDIIGRTPVVQLALPGPGIALAKLELQNLYAMKDRVAREVILRARSEGVLEPGAPVIESSSGTMALGLALVGRALGHPVHIVTDPRIDPITMSKLTALGCQVHVVDRMTGAGWQSARLELLETLLHDLPGAFWPRQYSNPANPAAYAGVAEEILRQVGEIDVLVGAVGSGGSLCGTARALRERLPDLRTVAVDCVGSMIFGQPDRPLRRQSGLGNSMQAPNVDYDLIDEVHWLSDDEAFAATRALAAEQQLFAGNSSGSVYRVITHLIRDCAPGTRVLGIFPDRGDRYTDTVHQAPPEPGDLDVRGEPETVAYGTVVQAWSRAELPRNRPPVVFLESNTTGSGMLALAAVRRLGSRPVLLTADRGRYPDADRTGAEIIDCDTNDLSAVLAAVGRSAAGPALVTTTSEYSLELAATANRRLGLVGPDPLVMSRCRNKFTVREVLAGAGIEQPRFALVDGVEQVPSAVAGIGLPCVVKPTQDSGSNLVRTCASTAEAVEAVAAVLAVTHNVRGQPAPRQALVEQYLDGPEYSVEVLCAGGAVHPIGVTAKSTGGSTGVVETGHVFPAPLSSEQQAELESAAQQVVSALGWQRGAAHLELRLGPGGARLVEINARLAGGMIPELIRLATGIDVIEQQLRVQLGMPLHLQPTKDRTAGIAFLLAPRSGIVAGVSGIQQARRVAGVEQVVVTARPGASIAVAGNAYDRVGYTIAVGQDAAAVHESLRAAAAVLTVDMAEQSSPEELACRV